MAQLTGGCNCGAIRFEATAPAAPGSVRMTQGEDRLRAWTPSDGMAKAFCGDCGSHLFTCDPESGEVKGVRLGAIDGDPGVEMVLHQYVAYAAPWEQIPDDGLPRYDEYRPR